jgi:hypothetical protein
MGRSGGDSPRASQALHRFAAFAAADGGRATSYSAPGSSRRASLGQIRTASAAVLSKSAGT